MAQGLDRIEPIPGARSGLTEAAKHLRVGVVSSSPRALVDRVLQGLGVDALVRPEARVGADQVTRPKPNPEGFLLAAERLGVSPQECVVFEDSRAGLLAARSAGMASMLVLCRCDEQVLCRTLATGACQDYERLPPDFWVRLAHGEMSLFNQDWLER